MKAEYLLRNSFFAALMLSAPMAYAVEDGFYMGLGVGQTSVDAKGQTVNGQAATAKKTGMGGRLFMGGQFNSHGAFEMGFTHYAPAGYDVAGPNGNKPAIRMSAVDFSFKGMLPFHGLTVFGRPGLAIAHSSWSGNLATTAGNRGPTSTTIRPEIGFGIGYDISQTWVVDLSIQRLFGSGIIRPASLIAVSFSYHIVDLKCGQFLC